MLFICCVVRYFHTYLLKLLLLFIYIRFCAINCVLILFNECLILWIFALIANGFKTLVKFFSPLVYLIFVVFVKC